MISYDSYKNRIEKVAKFKRFVFKFKFLFIGIFALIIAAITGLLVAKGSISGATVLSASEIYYGDAYEVTPASAFMSTTSVEYASEGSNEWSAEKPVKAGRYVARTVSKKTAGKGHGAATSFEIKPVEARFVISADSVVYGDVPAYAVQGLKLGDRVDGSSLKFIYDDYTSAQTNISVDKNALKIVNGDDDRSGCYILSSEPKAMNIRERAVTLAPKTQNAVYSGKAVALSDAADALLSSLAEGDRAEFVTTVKRGNETLSSAIDAGNYTLELSSVRILKGDLDVTAHYTLSLRTAMLQVAQKQLKITTEDKRRTFDGTPLVHDKFDSEGLIEGHSITPSNFKSVVNATLTPVENTADFAVFDGTGANVTHNYLITPVYGKLTVDRYRVEVTTLGAEKTYDGTALSQKGYLNGTMLTGYRLGVISAPEITDAVAADNELILGVTDAGGVDSSNNFEIIYTYGKLKITPLSVTVRVAGGEKVYDGAPLSVFDCAAINGTALVGGQAFTIGKGFQLVNAGEEENAVEVLVASAYKDETANYALTFVREKLKITPRPITVLTATSEHVYDAQSYSDTGYTTSYGAAAGLLNGDTLIVVKGISQRDVGSTQNICEYRVPNGNYTIERTVYGTLRVTPRPITVVTATSEHIYDAVAYLDASYTTSYGTEAGLLNGDTLVPTKVVSILEVGSISNTCTYQAPDSGNYTIVEVISGTLRVTPRPITVVTFDAEKIYDGTPLSRTDYKTHYENDKNKDGLLNGDKLTLDYAEKLTAATSVENACRYTVPNRNYKITGYECGTLRVTPRPLLVTTFDGTKIYDSSPLSRTDYDAKYYDILTQTAIQSEKGLIGNDTLECTKVVEITDVGAIQNSCEYRASSSNYQIVRTVYGTLTVTPRPILVITLDAEKIYDATPLDFTQYRTEYYGDAGKAGLLNGDTLTVLTKTEITDFGTKENVCTYSVPVGIYGNANYEIKDYENGTLKIKARPLTVYTASKIIYYDGKPLFDAGYTTKYVDEAGTEHDGLLNGDVLTFVSGAEITDAGKTDNTCVFGVPNANYEITGYEYGTLSVLTRTIVVTTASDTQIYDGNALSNQGYTTKFHLVKGFEAYHRDGTDTGLFGEDKLTQIISSEITDAGTIDNEFVSYKVPIGINGIANYVVDEWILGTLTVTPRPLSVATNDADQVYDGTPLTAPEPTATYYGDANEKGLLNGDQLMLIEFAEITDKGTKVNKCTYAVPIGVYDNPNYEIKEYDYGTLEVTARPITVIPFDMTVKYGGSVYPEHLGNFKDAAACDLAEGEKLKIVVKFYQSAGDGFTEVTPKNVGGYAIRLDAVNCVIARNGAVKENGISNYKITTADAGLVISPKPITVTAKSESIVYGYDYNYPQGAGNFVNAASSGLEYGESLEIFVEVAATEGRRWRNVGEYAVTPIADHTLVNGLRTGVNNYEITYENGTLTVIQRRIRITPKSMSAVYGDPIVYPSGTDNYILITDTGFDDLAEGDALELAVYYSCGERPEVGEYQIQIDLDHTFINGTNNLSNYIVELGRNTLTITEMCVPIERYDVADITYGEEFVYPDNEKIGNFKNASTAEMAYGEQLALKVSFRATGRVDAERGVAYEVVIEFALYDENDNPINERRRNYVFDCGEASYVYRKQAAAAFTVPDEECLYGEGESLFGKEYTITTELGENVTFTVKYLQDGKEVTPKYAGTYDITLDQIVSPVDFAEKYVFSVQNGTLTVKPRDISVVLSDVTVEYGNTDFYPVFFNNFANAETCGLQYGEKLQFTVNTYDSDPKNIGNYRQKGLSVLYFDAEENRIGSDSVDILNANYNVEWVFGTLHIIPKPLTVQVNDSKTYYGERFSVKVVVSETAYGEAFDVALQCQKDGAEVTPRNAGKYDIVPLPATATINGAADGLSNYDITWANGTLTIEPRGMIFAPIPMTLVYGEEFHYPTGVDNFTIELSTSEGLYDTLAYDDEVEITVLVMGETGYISDRSKLSVGTYSLQVNTGGVNSSQIIVNGEIDKNNNYMIFSADRLLTVNPRPIEIQLSEVENDGCAYGDVFTYPTGRNNFVNYLTVDAAYHETFEISVFFKNAAGKTVEAKNAGVYSVLFDTMTVYDEAGNIVENGAGNYEVKIINSVSAEIVKMNVSITVGETVAYYGDVPLGGSFAVDCEIDPDTLPYGEELHGSLGCRRDGVEAFPSRAGVYELYFREGSMYISVLDDYGNEIEVENGLDNYNIVIDTENGRITILPRPITIVTESADKVYDGTPLSAVGYRVYTKRLDENGMEIEDVGLVYGDDLKVNIASWNSITDFGSLKNSFDYRLPDEENYVLQEEIFGTLTVKRRPIVVTTNDATKIYDGTPLSDAGYTTVYYNENGEAEAGLLNGDALLVGFVREVIDAREYDNDCTYFLPNDNYEFAGDTVYGKLTVEKRTVFVSSANDTQEYDGTPLTASGEYTAYHIDLKGNKADALVLNHKFKVKDAGISITDVGSVDNLSLAGIYDPTDPEKNVEDNYEIRMESVGKLTVTPRPIRVETLSTTREYNGKLLTNTGYKTYYLYDDTKEGLLNGEVLIPIVDSIRGITQVDRAWNTTEFTVPDGENGLPNYEIKEYTLGVLEVTPRPLAVELFPMNVLYGDGNYPSSDNNFANYETCNLVTGERLVVALKYFTEDGTTEVEAKNAGRYIARIDLENSVLYSAGGIEFTVGNYDITCADTTLEIAPRPITVKANEYVNDIYYGDAFSYPNLPNNFYLPETAGLQYGETLQIFVDIVGAASDEGVVAVYPNAGKYDLVIDGALTLVNGSRDGIANYDITYADGALRIQQRPITVITATNSHVYDGTEFSDTSYNTHFYRDPNRVGLLSGDWLELDESFDYTKAKNVGEYRNNCEFKTSNSNYKILAYVNGTLTVIPCEITVILDEVHGTVYGEALTYPTGINNFTNASSCALAEGERLEVGVEYLLNGTPVQPKNAGDYVIRLVPAKCKVYDKNNELIENGIGNYVISCADRMARIERRALEIMLADMPTSVYDGDTHSYPAHGYTLLNGTFSYEETLTVAALYYTDAARTQVCGVPLNAGTYYMAFDADGSYAGGISASVNYEITCNFYPTYTISPKALTITMSDLESVYDGLEYSINRALNSQFRVDGLCGGDRLSRTVEYSAQPLNAGKYVITYDESAFAIYNGLTSNYYLDEVNSKLSCELTILKRTITVTVLDRDVEHTGNPVKPEDEAFNSFSPHGQGFVVGDEKKVRVAYTYDGSSVPPVAIGKYTVDVIFTEDEVTANYDIACVSGTLVITGRIVMVQPVYTGDPYVYDGEKVDLSLFTFEHRHVGDDLAEDDRYGFLESDLEGVRAEYSFTLKDEVYANGDTPMHAGVYLLQIRLFGYDDVNYSVHYDETVTFEIFRRPIVVNVGDLTVPYANAKPTVAPEFTAEGLLEQDEAEYAVRFYPAFLTVTDAQIMRYNVGQYHIKAEISAGRYEDYVITDGVTGTLTITAIEIYVRPIDKNDFYTGQNITLGAEDYVIFDGALANGDGLKVTEFSNGTLDAHSKESVSAGIVRVEIYDLRNPTVSALDNYIVYTSANRNKENDAYDSSDYKSTLSFTQRVLYYYAVVPSGQNTFVYNGQRPTLVYSDLDALIRDATSELGGDGLYGGHRLQVTGTRLGAAVGEYYDWLKFEIVDENGNKVTRGYDLRLGNIREATITVLAAPVTIKFDSSVTNASIADGSVLTTAFDGLTVLDPTRYTVSGLMDGDVAEVVVQGSGSDITFAVLIYRPKRNAENEVIGRRTDRQECYELNAETPDGLTVKVETVPVYTVEEEEEI